MRDAIFQSILWALSAALCAAQAAESPVPPELIGTWVMREGSGSSFRDTRTGQFSAPNANVFRYVIQANGRYEHAALLSSSLYQCTMQVFGYETGAMEFEGDLVTFTDDAAKLKSTDNCRPQWNYEKPGKLGRQRYQWRLSRDQFGLKLILVRPGGKEDVFYRQ